MIDLAPGHKQGLEVKSPVLLGPGSVGAGEAIHPDLELRAVGAVVVGPVTLQNRAGAPMPRAAELPGGLLLETGGQNRGLQATLREFAPLWKRLGVPIVVQLADAPPRDLVRAAARLAEVEGVSGVELLLARGESEQNLRQRAAALARDAELPLWVRLPLERAVELAPVAVEAGANGLVVGTPPVGAAQVEGHVVRGLLYGPALFAVMLEAVMRVAALGLPVALLASGGIHTVPQAEQALACGARALLLDAVAWIEPAFPGLLAAALAAGSP